MSSQRLQHDTAWACARALLDLVSPCLRPEEHRDAFDEFYTAGRAALEAYEIQVERQQHRLRPGRN